MLNIEPLNAEYDEKAVLEAIGTALTEFYTSLTKTLDNINVDKILKRKNPYLYRAKGINSAGQIVGGILSAYVSSSEETIFGNSFFEPLDYNLVLKQVSSYLIRNSQKNDSVIRRGTQRGTYCLNLNSDVFRQLQLQFDELQQEETSPTSEEDTSLSLF